MLQKSLSIVLTILLLAPLNSGAAAWMAMSMSDSDLSVSTAQAHQHHDSHMNHGLQQHGDDHAHSMHGEDHNADDCEEHCMSCSNHCSSLALVSNHYSAFNQVRLQTTVAGGLVSNHSDLLYRPPIRA